MDALLRYQFCTNTMLLVRFMSAVLQCFYGCSAVKSMLFVLVLQES